MLLVNFVNRDGNFPVCIGLLSALILVGCSESGEVSKSEVNSSPPQGQDNHFIPNDDLPSVADSPEAEDESEGGNLSEGQLYYRFQRDKLPENSAPDLQKHNEEIVGRPFLINVYQVNNQNEIVDVTPQVTWRTLDSNCPLGACFSLDENNRIISQNTGTFRLEASLDTGQTTPPITFISGEKLQACGLVGNMDKNHHNQTCLHIIEGQTGDAKGKWFSEPPRVEVMSNLLRYVAAQTPYNSGYTHGGYSQNSGSGIYASMRNDGYFSEANNLPLDQQGQYARYCQDLAQIHFNGRGNWRRITEAELTDLLTHHDLKQSYGWPLNGLYATSSISAGLVKSATDNGSEVFWSDSPLNEKKLATCVSKPPEATQAGLTNSASQ